MYICDTMVETVNLLLPQEILARIAMLCRDCRISSGLTQVHLAKQSNVSLAVLRKFEQSGKISLESFIKLSFTLGLTDNLLQALSPDAQPYASLDEVIAQGKKSIRKYAYSPRIKKNG